LIRLTVGAAALVLRVERHGADFIASAEREDNGDPMGIPCSAGTEAGALARMTAWLEWQSEHSAALEALQQSERAYHRAIAGSAFGATAEEPGELRKESLDAIEAARTRLDDIRARRPQMT
jgi:hypothetical protein